MALDVYNTLATCFCFYLVYRAYLQHTRWLLWLPVGLLFGFAMRGPIGLIIPALVVATFFLFTRQWKYFILFGICTAFLLAMATVVLLYFAYLDGGRDFLYSVLSKQAIGRLTNAHNPRYYFYFSEALIYYLFTVPFAIAVLICTRKQLFAGKKSPAMQLLTFAMLWIGEILLLMTIPHSKTSRYILPITPALALIAAYMFVDDSPSMLKLRAWICYLCVLLPIIGLLLTAAIAVHNHVTENVWHVHLLINTLSFTMLILAAWFMFRYYRRAPFFPMTIMLLGIISMMMIGLFIVYPVSNQVSIAHGNKFIMLPFWV